MNANDVIELVGKVGFPVLVAWFLLVRLDHTLHEVRDALKELTASLERQPPRPRRGIPADE